MARAEAGNLAVSTRPPPSPSPRRGGPVFPGIFAGGSVGGAPRCVCTWRGRGVRGLGPRRSAGGSFALPNSDAQADGPSGQECELVSLEAPLGCPGPVWAWDGGSATPGSPRVSLPGPPPPRLETRALGGERAPAAPWPGGPQGGVQEGVTSLGSL